MGVTTGTTAGASVGADGSGDDPPGTYGRRRALGLLLGAAGAATLAACGSGSGRSGGSASSTTGASSTSSTSASITAADCTQIPDETNGPYPADGSNGPDVLTDDGVVRTDIRSSFGDASGTAAGVPLTIVLDVVDVGATCAPVAGAAVYVWHCDREGRYSLYSSGVTGENYLRGVQATDASGRVRFTSIFPACYSGRWPHVHIEVYENVAAMRSGASPVKTSQLAFPRAACDAVFATRGYGQSVRNFSGMSLGSDNVFGDDGGVHELATVNRRRDRRLHRGVARRRVVSGASGPRTRARGAP
jgi:protocatechuate 3,4-dioxygenase beta subunit